MSDVQDHWSMERHSSTSERRPEEESDGYKTGDLAGGSDAGIDKQVAGSASETAIDAADGGANEAGTNDPNNNDPDDNDPNDNDPNDNDSKDNNPGDSDPEDSDPDDSDDDDSDAGIDPDDANGEEIDLSHMGGGFEDE